jgi:hypothetical protein
MPNALLRTATTGFVGSVRAEYPTRRGWSRPRSQAYRGQMTGNGSQQHEPGFPPGGEAAAGDVVEQGGRRLPSVHWRPPNWRSPRGAAALLAVGLAVGLVAGLAVGYTAGNREASRSAGPPRPAASSASPGSSLAGQALVAGGPALTQAIGTCAAQNGRDLQLGVQVTNQSTANLTLSLVHPVLPLGGLTWISQQWAPCGTLPTGQDPAVLTPGASTWFSVTFQVLVRCPGPLPVQFMVSYMVNGQQVSTSLPGFPDLGQVPYTGCAEG